MKTENRVLAAITMTAILGFSQLVAQNNDVRYVSALDSSYEKSPQAHEISMDLNLNEITYIEEEEPIDLAFDHYAYLPGGFDPYKGMTIALEDIEYIECEEELEFDVDTKEFLPQVIYSLAP